MNLNNRACSAPASSQRTPPSITPSQTTETLWFSTRPVPSQHIRLSTNEPIAGELAKAVKEGILRAVVTLKQYHPYKAKWIVGRDIWAGLSRGDRTRAGRCLADIARGPDSGLFLDARKGRSHRYYVLQPADLSADSTKQP